MIDERREWLARRPDEALSARLKAIAWVVSAVVLALVGVMQSIRIPLPEGWSTSFLPPFHASVNAVGAIVLVAAYVFVRRGRITWHRRMMLAALALSVLFLLSYVAYHMTNDPTRYGGTGPLRAVYFFLLITHILAAAVSFPFILFTFIAAWTNRFADHRRLARWVFPLWLYVAVTGPLCYWMLRPYY